jgi:peptidyl-prolyl cis-trans isomerase A (cyclophilin A)
VVLHTVGILLVPLRYTPEGQWRMVFCRESAACRLNPRAASRNQSRFRNEQSQAARKTREFPAYDAIDQYTKTMAIHTATATISTNLGDIRVNLFGDHAPKTVKNFTDLAEKNFYDGVIFHRIIPNFMVQGGDPTGTGTGGPGYTFDDEIHPELVFDRPYLLAMANAGKRPDMTGRLAGTNGSQFFVTTATTDWLNGKHTIFGEVADEDSKAVVDKISAVKTGAMDKPEEDVVMNSVTVEEA